MRGTETFPPPGAVEGNGSVPQPRHCRKQSAAGMASAARREKLLIHLYAFPRCVYQNPISFRRGKKRGFVSPKKDARGSFLWTPLGTDFNSLRFLARPLSSLGRYPEPTLVLVPRGSRAHNHVGSALLVQPPLVGADASAAHPHFVFFPDI